MNVTPIFLHIPKTAGSTLSNILSQNYRRRRIYTIDGRDPAGYWDRFRLLPAKERNSYACIRGRMRYGIHQFVDHECRYFTFLRDPIDTVVSHYYFARKKSTHHLHQKAIELSLEEYVRQGITKDVNNGMSRKLSGYADPVRGEPREPDLKLAKDNLRTHFTVVGITERFDQSLILLKRAFNWMSIFYQSRNINPHRQKISELSPKTVDVIREYNEMDTQLYKYANKRLEMDLESLEDWQSILQRFRRTNRLCGPLLGNPLYLFRRITRL